MTATTGTATSTRRISSGILRNVTSNWASLLVNIAISFYIAPLVVRGLGDVYYGIWTLLMQFTGYLWLFDVGIRESVVKYVSQYEAAGEHEALNDTVHTAVSIYFAIAVVSMLMTAGLALALPALFNIPAESVTTGRVTAVLFGLTVAQGFVFNVYVGVLMGLQKFYLMARASMAFALLRAALVVALVEAGYGIIELSLLTLLLSVASNLVVYGLCKKHLPYLSLRIVKPATEPARKLLNYGKYVFISNVGDKIIFATDSLVVGMFLPISVLVYFSIASSLIDHLRSFIMAMASIVNPLTSSLEASKRGDRIVTIVTTGTKTAVILGSPVCAGFVLLGSTFIDLWMGPTYGHEAGRVLAVLAAGTLIGLPYYTISGVLYGLNRHRVIAWLRILEGAANLVLSVVLIQYVGLIGVAIGTAIPQAVVAAVVLPCVLPGLGDIRLREYYTSTYIRPFAASIPFWAMCWLLATRMQPQSVLSFMALVAASLVTYVVPCWFIALSEEERGFVRSALGRRLRPQFA